MGDKAMRSTGTAVVSFGMVSVPIKIYSATETSSSISFNLLHKGCGSRLKQHYTCIDEGTIVERVDMEKGYEFTKGAYVTFTAEELKSLEEKSTHTIDIVEFVPTDKIDPVYFDKAYFLAPDKGGGKAYSLLAAALQESGRAAIAHYSARGKAYIVMLRPCENGIAMQTLLYDTEVRSIKDVGLEPMPIKDAEKALALQLVDSLCVETFDPSKFKDDVQERIQKAIDEKVAGKPMTIPVQEPVNQMVDIMAALQASLAAAAGTKKAKG